MRFIHIITILLFLLAVPVLASPYETSTVKEIGPFGDTEVETRSEHPGPFNPADSAIGVYIPPAPDSEAIWHYFNGVGLIQRMAPIGYDAGYVFP